MKLLLKNLLFTIVVPGTVSVWLPYAWFWGRRDFEPGPWRWLAYVFIAAGTAIYLRCVADFMFAGRGTPAPIDPPKTLVARGAYRFVRNPMYLGVLLVLAGEALLFPSRGFVLYILFFWVAVNLFVMGYEEPTLRKQFGESYENYLRTVPRWIPKVRGGRANVHHRG